MQRLLILLCLLTGFLYADEEETPSKNIPFAENHSHAVIDLGGEPSAIVNGCINVITGSFCESEKDIVFHGAVKLALERFYSSSNAIGTKDNSDLWHIAGISTTPDT